MNIFGAQTFNGDKDPIANSGDHLGVLFEEEGDFGSVSSGGGCGSNNSKKNSKGGSSRRGINCALCGQVKQASQFPTSFSFFPKREQHQGDDHQGDDHQCLACLRKFQKYGGSLDDMLPCEGDRSLMLTTTTTSSSATTDASSTDSSASHHRTNVAKKEAQTQPQFRMICEHAYLV